MFSGETAPGDTLSDPADTALMCALRDLDKSIEAVRDAATFTADAKTLGDALCEMVTVQNKSDALRLELLTSARRAGVPQLVGLRTLGQYVASRTNADPAPINTEARLARWLEDFPTFAGAAADGDLSKSHLWFIRSKLDTANSHFELRSDQEFFAKTAIECDFAGFQTAAAYWLVHIDPDGKEPKDQITKSRLSLRKGPGGRIELEAEGDAITGTALETAIEFEANKLRKADADSETLRSHNQYRYMALVNLVARGHVREDGTHPIPLVNMVMSEQVAKWAYEQLQNPTCDPVPVSATDVDGRCELIDGTPVHPLLVMAMTGLFELDYPALRRYVLDADSRILDYSSSARTFPEHMRTAQYVQSRGKCGTPGCNCQHHWLQIDHVDPVSNGGETTMGNGQPQCPPDNQAKTNTTGHTPWRDKPPIPKYRRQRISGDRGSQDDSDDDDHLSAADD